MKRIETMFDMQMELNNKTNGACWVDGVTKSGRIVNWNRCIYSEANEYINSFGWKHWHDINRKDDIENAKIEIVDIWHFIMSDLIEKFGLFDAKKITIESYAKYAKKCSKINSTHTDGSYSRTDPNEFNGFFEPIESLMYLALKHNNIQPNGEGERESYVASIIHGFIRTCCMIHISLAEVYELYIAKNTLNAIRVDFGYRDGNYLKMWMGEEDNVVVSRIIKEVPDILPEHLYNQLAEIYTKQVQKLVLV